MKEGQKQEQLKRMNYLIGHLQGVKKMIEEDRYCIDVIKQSMAVCEAIKKVNQTILANHLQTCVMSAIKGSNGNERRKKLKELLEIYKAYTK